jgi:hypothetical protein
MHRPAPMPPPPPPAGLFLQELGAQLMLSERPGAVLRVALPKVPTQLSISPPRRIAFSHEPGSALEANDSWVELQIPPDCGNGRWNAGISLARLLWHVPRPALLTLFASLLLERRVILVGQSRDTVSLAVQAASALLYPFKWHHIYLPILPKVRGAHGWTAGGACYCCCCCRPHPRPTPHPPSHLAPSLKPIPTPTHPFLTPFPTAGLQGLPDRSHALPHRHACAAAAHDQGHGHG